MKKFVSLLLVLVLLVTLTGCGSKESKEAKDGVFTFKYEDMTIALDDCKVDGAKVNYSYGGIYTTVEYIESTGTQYINTEFIPTSETRVIMNFESDEFANDATVFVSSWNTNGFAMITIANTFRWHNGIQRGFVYQTNKNYTIIII